jgi:hypothetical protein
MWICYPYIKLLSSKFGFALVRFRAHSIKTLKNCVSRHTSQSLYEPVFSNSHYKTQKCPQSAYCIHCNNNTSKKEVRFFLLQELDLIIYLLKILKSAVVPDLVAITKHHWYQHRLAFGTSLLWRHRSRYSFHPIYDLTQFVKRSYADLKPTSLV